MSTVVRVTSGDVPYRQDIQIGSHHLVADEPQNLGGGDLGPEASQLLLAALGACTATTLQMYAARKGWKLEKVDVELTLAREKEITRIGRTIHLRGELDEEKKARLLEIANRCPVHRILTEDVQVETHVG